MLESEFKSDNVEKKHGFYHIINGLMFFFPKKDSTFRPQ